MRVTNDCLLLLALLLPPGCACAQVAVSAPSPAPATLESTAGSLVRPAVARLDGTIAALDPDKWKLPRSSHEEMRRNLESIHRDVATALPPLLTAADAVPVSAQAELELLRNLDALYDVALRVAATAGIAAPAQQSTGIEQALSDLLTARRSLGDRLATDLATQQKSLSDLRAAARTSATPAATVCPPVVTPPAAAKPKPRRPKPAPKPSTAPVSPSPAP